MRFPMTVLVAALLLLAFGFHCATRSIDFPLYRQAAAQVVAGDYELYPPGLTDPAQTITRHSFRYAPILALLFVPLAFLPVSAGAALFYVLKLLAIVYVWRVLARRLPSRSTGRRLMLLGVLITGGYLAEEFRNGNLHFLVIVLLVLAFDTAQRGRVLLPAVALAVAILAKVLPLLLLAYFVLRQRYRVAAATVVAVLLLVLAPALVFGWDTNVRLTRTFARFAVMKADEQANHSLRGALFRFLTVNDQDDPRNPDWNVASLSPRTVTGIWLACVAAGGAILVVMFRRAPRNEEHAWLELSLLLVVMLLASPHTQRIYYAGLLVPVAVALTLVDRHRREQGTILLKTSLVAIGVAGTLMPFVLSTRRFAVAFEALSPHVLVVSLFAIALVAFARRGTIASHTGG